MLMRITQPSEVADKMVSAAERLMTALAMERYLEPIVTGYQRDVLERLQFKVAPEHCASFGEQLILSPDQAHLLSQEDRAIYVAETIKARIAAQLVVASFDECPLAVATAERIQAEDVLLAAISDIPQLEGVRLAVRSEEPFRSKAVAMALQFLEPYTRTDEEIIADLIKAGRMA